MKMYVGYRSIETQDECDVGKKSVLTTCTVLYCTVPQTDTKTPTHLERLSQFFFYSGNGGRIGSNRSRFLLCTEVMR